MKTIGIIIISNWINSYSAICFVNSLSFVSPAKALNGHPVPNYIVQDEFSPEKAEGGGGEGDDNEKAIFYADRKTH